MIDAYEKLCSQSLCKSDLRVSLPWVNLLVGMLLAVGSVNAVAATYPVDGAELYVDIEGTQPDGYNPNWGLGVRALDVSLVLDGSDRLFQGQLQLVAVEGRSSVLFRVAGLGEFCQADITSERRKVVLGREPAVFTLSNFHPQAGSGPCQENSRRARDWTGQLTILAASGGDLKLDLVLETPDRRGKSTRLVATSIPVKNRAPLPGASGTGVALASAGKSPTAPGRAALVANGVPGQYNIDGGSLSVAVQGTYPEGYGPAWDFVGRGNEAVLRLDGSDRLVRASLLFSAADGRSTVSFRVPGYGEACIGDLQPSPAAVVLGKNPQVFTLVNLRRDGPGGPCTEPGGRRTREWSVRIALVAASNGNISLDLDFLTEADGRGRQALLSARAVPMNNRMTPDGAVADIAQKAEAGRRNEQARQDAVAAMQLPEPDLAPLDGDLRPSSSLSLAMSQIDDFGFAIVVTPDGTWRGVADAEWNQGVPGQVREDLVRHFQTGDNLLIFGLHNKRFAFGPGRWTFRFELADEKGLTWVKGGGAAGGSVGIRYWKPFVVNKSRSGQLTVHAASADKAAPVIERMKAFNTWLIREMGSEKSMMAVVAGALTQSLMESMSGGGGSASSDRQGERLFDEQRAEDRKNLNRQPTQMPVAPISPSYGMSGQ